MVFSCYNFSVKNLPVSGGGGDSRKKNSFHVYMYAYAYQDHEDVNWRSVRGVKRNS